MTSSPRCCQGYELCYSLIELDVAGVDGTRFYGTGFTAVVNNTIPVVDTMNYQPALSMQLSLESGITIDPFQAQAYSNHSAWKIVKAIFEVCIFQESFLAAACKRYIAKTRQPVFFNLFSCC